MELSMTIALVSALAIGEFFTALVIAGFVLAAEVLEGLTVGRGRRAIQDLLDFLLGGILNGIHIPDAMLTALWESLDRDQQYIRNESAAHRAGCAPHDDMTGRVGRGSCS